MLLCKHNIKEFAIVASGEVTENLKKGYLLYGAPIPVGEKQFYQGIVKIHTEEEINNALGNTDFRERIPLSDNEIKTLALLADGIPIKSIAATLNKSVAGMQWVISSMIKKMGVKNKIGLIVKACRLGYI